MRKSTPAYLEHLAIRNYSPQTILSQSKQLRHFREFCTELGIKSATQVTRQIVADYQAHLFHHRQWLTAVASFMSWLTRRGLIATNPASDLEMPRTEHRLPKAILTTNEVERVLRIPDTGTPFGLRDRAILEVFYSTGIRRNELCRLNLTDLDFERGVVRVEQGKGRKDRYVPIGDRALDWVTKYLTHSRPRLGKISDQVALFLGTKGQRVHPGRLASHIHDLILRARLGKTGSCHLFRHSFATALLENGCDIRHIQAMMGHAKLETTAIYIHLNMRDLKTAHEKFHPAKLPRDKGVRSAADPRQLLLPF
jgi:integrase/recombinase XerD